MKLKGCSDVRPFNQIDSASSIWSWIGDRVQWVWSIDEKGDRYHLVSPNGWLTMDASNLLFDQVAASFRQEASPIAYHGGLPPW